MRALPPVDTVPDLTLGIIDRDLALTAFNKHHRSRHRSGQQHNEQGRRCMERPRAD